MRIEKVNSSYPTQIRLSYSHEIGLPLSVYTPEDSQTVNSSNGILMGAVAVSGQELIVLNKNIEARVVQIELLGFKEKACLKMDFFGCQKLNCVGTYLFYIFSIVEIF